MACCYTLTPNTPSFAVRALRYRKIISDDNKLHQMLNRLKVKLVLWNCKAKTIDKIFNKALSHSQNELLFNIRKAKHKIPPFVKQYHETTKSIPNILWKH